MFVCRGRAAARSKKMSTKSQMIHTYESVIYGKLYKKIVSVHQCKTERKVLALYSGKSNLGRESNAAIFKRKEKRS